MDKKYIKNVLIYILSGVLSVLGIGYIVYHLAGSGEITVDTETAVISGYETVSTADALLFRAETVIEGEGQDTCGALRDGENAKVGDEVMWIFSGNEKIGDQIREIEAEIRVLQDSLVSDTIPSGLNTNNKELTELHLSMLDALSGNDLSGMQQITVDLQTRINLRKHSTTTDAAIRASIEELTKKRSELLEKNKEGVTTLTAPLSGMFYSYTDGFESLCTVETVSSMDLQTFEEIKNKVSADKKTNAGVGKMVSDAYWYIALTLDNETVRDMRVGNVYSICFSENENRTISMTLDRIDAQYGKDDSLLVFGCREVPQEFSFDRMQKVSVVLNTVEGFRVPSSAVRYVDGQVGVYVSDGNKVKFRRIDVLLAGDGYYMAKVHDTTMKGYTDMLRMYDKIVLSGKELYDGKYLD